MARERAPIFPFAPNLLHWSHEDPAIASGSVEEKKQAFLRVMDAIREKVEKFVNELEKDRPELSSAASV
jgi:hypothetical protein